jgi:hypothetical protein
VWLNEYETLDTLYVDSRYHAMVCRAGCSLSRNGSTMGFNEAV